jgi:hypothetical protein
MNILQMLIQGRFNRALVRSLDMQQIQQRLKLLIDNHCHNQNNNNDNVNKYVHQLFSHICTEWQNKIHLQFAHLFSVRHFAGLAPIFIHPRVQFIHLPLFFELFARCPKMTIDATLYPFVLSNELMQFIFENLKNMTMTMNMNNPHLTQLHLLGIDEQFCSIDECHLVWSAKFEQQQWLMSKSKSESNSNKQELELELEQFAVSLLFTHLTSSK